MTDADEFAAFFADAEPRLRRAFVGVRGIDGAHDATAEALAWAWEHWSEVRAMTNPVGYLYRVGQSKSRAKRQGSLPQPEQIDAPEIEPGLVPALEQLPDGQRTAVWLVHACGWTYTEAADGMGISRSTVGTHVSRGLDHLRKSLEVEHHG